MPKNTEIAFSEAKQDRSKKTLDDLFVAAHAIVETSDPENFTSRMLSKKSGYSLGTLNKRLTSVDKIFLWAIKKGQQKHLEKMVKLIDGFDSTLPLRDLLGELVDSAFSGINQVNPYVIRYFDDRIKRYNSSHNQNHFPDALVEPFLAAIKRDQTDTFRKISQDELRLILRTTSIFIERPFVESDHFAGSEEHRRMALENLVRLLGA